MGAGQFCTKPALVFIPDGTGFAAELAEDIVDLVEQLSGLAGGSCSTAGQPASQ